MGVTIGETRKRHESSQVTGIPTRSVGVDVPTLDNSQVVLPAGLVT
jgi:hypothetical protein